MKSKKIFTRILFASAIILIISIIMGVIGMYGIYSTNTALKNVFEENVVAIQYVGEVNANFLLASLYSNRMTLETFDADKAKIDDSYSKANTSYTALEKYMELYKTTMITDEERTLVSKMEASMSQYKSFLSNLYSKAIESITSGDVESVKIMLDEGAVIRDSVNADLTHLTEMNAGFAEDARESSQSSTNFIFFALIAFMALGLIISIAMIASTSMSIERDLKTVVSKLNESASVIDTASTQLAEASESLANGSSRQAAAIEETSATMNESASMVKQTAENTRQAAQLAKTTNGAASEGMSKMSNMVQTMEDIKESSDLMSRTIKVIDDIAFQTNLLAINATVEAARAGGEAGRSFGVVAEEVRNLAQKSAQAAADTADTIEKNVALTNQGREVSREVAESLKKITSEADELSKIINEINAASEEQASGISQINTAITQMEKVTQQNAAVAEENAASSGSMKDEIFNLREAVGIAEQLLRDSSSSPTSSKLSSSSSKRQMPSFTTTPSNSSSFSSGSPTKSAPKPVQKSQSSSSSSSNSAEKIIPLDDDDTF